MPLRRPRRIFIRSPSGHGPRRGSTVVRTLAIGLAGAAAGALAIMMSLSSDLFGRVPAASGTVSADALSVSVVDGQTLRLHDTVLRLSGVAAPVRGAACRREDGRSYDCGAAAAVALAAIIGGRSISCQIDGRDGSGFPQARCDVDGADLSRAIVAAGWARAQPVGQPPRQELDGAEVAARAARRGVWAGGPGASF